MVERRKIIVPEFAKATNPGQSPPNGIQSRFATRIFSSLFSMLVLIPGLMLLAGGGLVWMGQSGLRQATENALRQRVTDEATNVSRATTDCLDQAQPLLAALSEAIVGANSRDPAAFAVRARTLLKHRPGVANVGFAGIDGSRLEVTVDSEDHGQAIRLHHWFSNADGTMGLRTYDIAADGTLTAIETIPKTEYDARKRPYYAPAAAVSVPVWTDPYEFVMPKVIGITCSQAVRDPSNGALLGVATVDFDLATLSDIMRQFVLHGPRGSVAFLFARNGTLLATSGDLADVHQREDRKRAVAAISSDLPEAGAIRFLDLASAGLPTLLGVRGIQVANGPIWFAGIRAPREVLGAEAAAQLNRTFAVGLVGLLIAVGLAVLLANHLARQRRITTAARAAVATAEERLRAMGSYTLIQELGAGGMGTVWRAQHHLLARPAALKLIRMDMIAKSEAQRKEALGRFEREAKATASLHSRNTITLYDYGLAADGTFYYAMELLDGLDLHRLVVEHGPQPIGRVVQILIQVCLSLAEAHACSMVHRDIKPANIYLCRLGIEVDVVKVLDFGLVAHHAPDSAQLSQVGIAYGTPAFMAPEQAQGGHFDGRADLYAVGCLAYWLLSGKPVFKKPDAMAMMIAHVNERPRQLSALVQHRIPAALETLVMTLLAKAPDERPCDAVAVIAALRSIDIPTDQAWAPVQAEAWWKAHRPVGSIPPAPAGPADAATVMI